MAKKRKINEKMRYFGEKERYFGKVQDILQIKKKTRKKGDFFFTDHLIKGERGYIFPFLSQQHTHTHNNKQRDGEEEEEEEEEEETRIWISV